VFVTVKTCDFVWPSTTLPKLKLEGETLRPACTPVPLKATESGDPFASLTSVTEPVTLPVALGEKSTSKVTLADGLIVAGVVTPFTLKPFPVTLMLDTRTGAVPMLLKMTCFELVLPLATLPKLQLVGLVLSCPIALDVPVPLKVTVVVGFAESLLVIVMLPLVLPAPVGEKVTVTGTFCPELMTFGVVMPVIPNSAPVKETIETVRSVLPAFESTRLAVPFDPIDTVPRFNAALLTDNCGCEVITVPARLALTGEDPASPCTFNVPLTLPIEVPLSHTKKLKSWLGARAVGRVTPLMLNCELENETC